MNCKRNNLDVIAFEETLLKSTMDLMDNIQNYANTYLSNDINWTIIGPYREVLMLYSEGHLIVNKIVTLFKAVPWFGGE